MSSLGDIIHALPSLYALRKAYPDARITWAVHPAFAGILPGKPWINEVYLVDRKRIKQLSYWKEIRKDLHAHHFDLVIDLQMIAKSGLISFLSGGKEKIGYHDGREGSFLFSKPISGPHKHGHIIEQLLDVMRYLGCPADKIEFPLPDLTKEMETVTTLLRTNGVKGSYVLLVPGTRGDYKKWPIEYWGELARKLAEDKITTVIAGSKGEMPMGEAIRKISPSPYTVNLMGQTNLLELAALEKWRHFTFPATPVHFTSQTPSMYQSSLFSARRRISGMARTAIRTAIFDCRSSTDEGVQDEQHFGGSGVSAGAGYIKERYLIGKDGSS